MINTDTLRKSFMAQGLQQSELAADPYQQFENWYQQTMQSDLPEPTAMSLATVDANNQPWQRMVLLKTFDRNGFVFFTNYTSRKAEHISNNARVSLLFPWHPMGRQVKVTGHAEKISTAESLKYFSSRPRGSQIGAWASRQSKVIKSRALLDIMFEQVKSKFTQGEIPLPDFWGGYRIKADTLEFWQARDDRLHDCFFYQKNDDEQWITERLQP